MESKVLKILETLKRMASDSSDEAFKYMVEENKPDIVFKTEYDESIGENNLVLDHIAYCSFLKVLKVYKDNIQMIYPHGDKVLFKYDDWESLINTSFNQL